MTLNLDGYTVGGNFPLTHSRILWQPVTGTVVADGTNGIYATNDYTSQRWALAAGSNDWVLTLSAAAGVDMVMIAAHNLTGRTVTISTSPDLVTAYTLRATVTPTDNSAIAALFNDDGEPISARRIKVNIDEGDGFNIGVIRAGVALQMPQPFYAGHTPIRYNRMTEGEQQISETGQWLGRVVLRRSISSGYEWSHIKLAWYRENLEPFFQSLPQTPFGIVGNPEKMTDDVAWGWSDSDPKAEIMGIKSYMQVGFSVSGLWS